MVLKLEYILKLKTKRNEWLLADTCPHAANHCALFRVSTGIGTAAFFINPAFGVRDQIKLTSKHIMI